MARRRKNGEGTLETRQSAKGTKYRIREKINGVRVDGPWANTPREAREAHQNALKESAERSSTKQTFWTYAENWLAIRKGSNRISPTTAVTYFYNVKALKKDPLGMILVCDVKPSDLKAWKARQDLADITIARRLGFIHEVLAHAGNPSRIDPPRLTESERRPFTDTEREILAKSLSEATGRQKLAVLMAVGLSVSRSEACGLKHEDRDGDGVWINRVVVIGEEAVHIRSKKKTDRRYRWIPLPDYLKPLIGPDAGKGYVLGTETTPANPKTFSQWMRDILKKDLGHVPYVGAHTLRRTCAMILLESGVDDRTAAEILGHDPATLKRVYARSNPKLKSDAVERAQQTYDPTKVKEA